MGGCFIKSSSPKADADNGNRLGNQGYQAQSLIVPHEVSAAQTQPPPARHKPQPQSQSYPPDPTPARPAYPVIRPMQIPVRILGKPFEDVKEYYTLGKELGRGQYGIIYLCTENSTGRAYACKSILKRKLVSKNDRDDVKREVQILQHLSGQPNIVEFRGAYEDRYSVHLVMELCAGGELFDRIIAQGHYSERAAAGICGAIVNMVHICHFMGVMHRDLKPENFLLSGKDDRAMLKATDFGLSVFIEEGDFLSSLNAISSYKF